MFDLNIQDTVAVLTMTNAPMNTLSRPWGEALHRVLDALDVRDDWQVLHVRSALKVFSAGADLKLLASRFERPDVGDVLKSDAGYYQQLFNRIERMERASLAEIGGAAVGGGLELALACDLRVASHSAKIGLPEVNIGLLPGAGGTQRLTRLCGRGVAMRVIATAELLTGEQAFSLGIVEWSVPAAELAHTAAAVVRRLATVSRQGIKYSKSCIAAASDPQRDGFAEELDATSKLVSTADTKQRVRAFIESARRPGNAA